MTGRPRFSRLWHSTRRQQAGVATLLIVMALFFLVSMVAAYTSRNLIFEQRTSANQYRSTQAFEAAEAGLEWALAMLNAGRVDNQCVASQAVGAESFRRRYVADLADKTAAQVPGTPGCQMAAAGWTCGCPALGAPGLAAPAGSAIEPSFRILFREIATPYTGFLTLESTGCTSANDSCLTDGSSRGTAGGAAARVTVLASLMPALATRPVAAVTVRGSLTVGGLTVVNTDTASNGITAWTGGGTGPGLTGVSAAGSAAPQAGALTDGSLAALLPDQLFARTFGMSEARFQDQPSTVRACDPADAARAANCADDVVAKAAANPGRPVWVMDDLIVDRPLTLGTVDNPVLLVVQKALGLRSAGIQVTGVVYSRGGIPNASGTGLIQGALMTEGDFGGTSAPDVIYDRSVIDRVRNTQGTIVRVPGSWRDF